MCSHVNRRPIRYGIKTVSCTRGMHAKSVVPYSAIALLFWSEISIVLKGSIFHKKEKGIAFFFDRNQCIRK